MRILKNAFEQFEQPENHQNDALTPARAAKASNSFLKELLAETSSPEFKERNFAHIDTIIVGGVHGPLSTCAKDCESKTVRIGKGFANQLWKPLYCLFAQTVLPINLIPVPISTPQIFVLLLLTMGIFIVLLLPAILERKKPKDTGPRKILEPSGREIVGFSVLLTVYFRENPREAKLLEDIETPEFSPASKSLPSISLPDIEF
jgi:hypothetical protein